MAITLGNIMLTDISSSNSNSSAYDTINRNFRKVKENLDYISVLPLDDLKKLIFPSSATANTDYVLNFDGSKYNISPIRFSNKGTKWKIRSDETIDIGADFQYLLHNRIDIEGKLDIEGELVIL